MRSFALCTLGLALVTVPPVVWLTHASDIQKTYPGWENAVTFAEMCQWKALGNSFPK